MPDKRWLQKRGQTYYAVKEVPRALRDKLGRRFVKSLGTPDLTVAIAQRHAALADFQRQIEQARRTTTPSPFVEAGMVWRQTFARIAAGDSAQIAAFSGRPEERYDPRTGETIHRTARDVARDVAEGVLSDQVARVVEDHGEAAASALHGVAYGRATPLQHYVPSWLAEGGSKGPLRGRTKQQYETDVARLVTWAQSAGVPPTIEAFDRKTAGRFVTDAVVSAGVHPKTGNKWLSAASAYWRWLRKRGHTEADPWANQSLPKARPSGGDNEKRPFTAAELPVLFAGPADPELADGMRVAALSGLRIEEIFRLTVGDCAGGWFNIHRRKNDNSRRRVPIHPALAPIVTRRTAGRPSDAFLFQVATPRPRRGPVRETGPALPPEDRSMAASKRFGTYRRRLGVHDRAEGQRQSRVDFHSFRRWFITAALRAGQQPHIVSAVVGHEEGRKGMTLSVYDDGPSDAQLRACVEAVRLPT